MSGPNTDMLSLPEFYREPEATRKIARIASSFRLLTGRELVPTSSDPVLTLWQAPQVIVAHGTEADPLFFFANHAALGRFETNLDLFIGSPSRFSAEAPVRAERDALLVRVRRDGYIDDYVGVRISAKSRRFRIEQATVWNLIDEHGAVHGQAAAFDQWTELG